MFGEAFDGNDATVGQFTKNDPPPPRSSPSTPAKDPGPTITGDQLDSAFYFPQHYQGFRDVMLDASRDRAHRRSVGQKDHQLRHRPARAVRRHPALQGARQLHRQPRRRPLPVLGQPEPDRQLPARQRALLHNALLLLFTAQGIPCLYYGTEQEFRGGNDPSNREDMWRPLPYLGQKAPPAFDTGGPTFQFIQRLIGLRSAYPALRRGDAKVVYSTAHTGDEPDAGIFAFERTGGDSPNYALIVLNTNQVHDSSTKFEMATMMVERPQGRRAGRRARQQSAAYTVASDGTLDLTLAPVTGLLLVPQQDVK
jgi:alpha-amylase